MQNEITKLETEIKALKNAIEKGWSDQHDKLKEMEAELDRLLAEAEESQTEELTQLNDDMPVDDADVQNDEPSVVVVKLVDPELTEAQQALATLDFIEQNDQTAELLNSFNTQQNRFMPLLADSKLQFMVAISQLSNAYCKDYRHILAYKCADLTTAQTLVGVRCALDFDEVVSDREDSYQIQAEMLKAPYASHGIVLDGSITNSVFRSHQDKAKIKHGSTFIATTTEWQYDHNKRPLVVAYVKDAIQLVQENVQREDFSKLNPKTDMGIMEHKFNRQKWRNELNDTIKGYLGSAEIDKLTADLVPETAKAWKPFLVIAKMISDEAFMAVFEVMQKYTANRSLPDIYKICIAVDLALPKFKALIAEYGFQSCISQKLIDKWLEHYGQKLNPSMTKKALDDAQVKSEPNQFCFGVNTTGYKIVDIEKLVTDTLATKQERVKTLKDTMLKHVADKTQKPAKAA